jgi:hypothetical protein
MTSLTKYLLIATAIIAAFTNFIACGAQFYKASLDGDHSPKDGAQSANSTDPSSPEYGLHAPSGWANLPIHYKSDINMSPTQLKALQAGMKTWEISTGRTLFIYDGVHAGITGDNFPDLYSSLRDAVNGQYFDAQWKKTGKQNMILATTIWNNPGNAYQTIDAADIRYNSEIYFISDALKERPVDQREIVDMQSLATHELGHLLGLAHVPESFDSSSIMNPSILIGEGLANRSLSVGDIKRVQKIYGCQGSSCDADQTAMLIQHSGMKYGLSGESTDASGNDPEQTSSEPGH